ncbi:MAG TPA: HAMP domain-containing sensor histidine kinase [Terriglobales bacterium]|nr:HAMP domain-containing sensor histidine kinase [Terriglobales bacterium]
MSDDPAQHRAAIDKGLAQVERLLWLFNITRTFFAEDFTHGSELFALKECLDAVIADCSPLAESKNVRLQLDIRDNPSVFANRQHLQHALENILNVCFRSTNPGETLTIKAECSRQIRIQIPCGRMFSPDERDSAFHPFPPGVEVKPGQAANLDLALSRRIVQSFSGEVTIVQGPAQNCLFQVTLPIPLA